MGYQSYQFYINGNPQLGSPSSIATYSLSSSSFNDGDVLRVRAYVDAVPNSSTCYDEATLTIRVNSFTGANTIANSQNVCSGETPVAFTSTSTPSVDRFADGATFTYQWQLRTGTNAFKILLALQMRRLLLLL